MGRKICDGSVSEVAKHKKFCSQISEKARWDAALGRRMPGVWIWVNRKINKLFFIKACMFTKLVLYLQSERVGHDYL
jgi:hypothetical protein